MKCDDVRLSANLKQDWSGGVSLLTGGVGILESGCWSGGVMVVWGLEFGSGWVWETGLNWQRQRLLSK